MTDEIVAWDDQDCERCHASRVIAAHIPYKPAADDEPEDTAVLCKACLWDALGAILRFEAQLKK